MNKHLGVEQCSKHKTTVSQIQRFAGFQSELNVATDRGICIAFWSIICAGQDCACVCACTCLDTCTHPQVPQSFWKIQFHVICCLLQRYVEIKYAVWFTLLLPPAETAQFNTGSATTTKDLFMYGPTGQNLIMKRAVNKLNVSIYLAGSWNVWKHARFWMSIDQKLLVLHLRQELLCDATYL